MSTLTEKEKGEGGVGLAQDGTAGGQGEGALNSAWPQSPVPHSMPRVRGCWGHCSTFLMISLFAGPESSLPLGVPIVAQCIKNLTSFHEEKGSIPGPAQWAK